MGGNVAGDFLQGLPGKLGFKFLASCGVLLACLDEELHMASCLALFFFRIMFLKLFLHNDPGVVADVDAHFSPAGSKQRGSRKTVSCGIATIATKR